MNFKSVICFLGKHAELGQAAILNSLHFKEKMVLSTKFFYLGSQSSSLKNMTFLNKQNRFNVC